MKKILLVISFMLTSVMFTFAQVKEEDKELKAEAAKISKELSLDSQKEHLVYNVLRHVKSRIADIPIGHENYNKLIGYINEERIGMMKAIMTTSQYKQYEVVYGKIEKQKIDKILANNAEHVKKHGVLVNRVSGADISDDNVFDQNSEDSDDSDDSEKTEKTEQKQE